jgi:hypothetical protein
MDEESVPQCYNCSQPMRHARTVPAESDRKTSDVFECVSCHVSQIHELKEPGS